MRVDNVRKKNLPDLKNRGLYSERILGNNPREKAFAELWEKENIPASFINYGYGILQDLFIANRDGTFHHFGQYAKTVINKRDRYIVATVIQWLGSNVGMSFIKEALNSCGYDVIVKKDE